LSYSEWLERRNESSESLLGRIHREKCTDGPDCVVCKFYGEVTAIQFAVEHPALKALWEVESEREERDERELQDDSCNCPQCGGPVDPEGECLDLDCQQYLEDEAGDREMSEAFRLGESRY
jgi:hypothetical protein